MDRRTDSDATLFVPSCFTPVSITVFPHLLLYIHWVLCLLPYTVYKVIPSFYCCLGTANGENNASHSFVPYCNSNLNFSVKNLAWWQHVKRLLKDTVKFDAN